MLSDNSQFTSLNINVFSLIFLIKTYFKKVPSSDNSNFSVAGKIQMLIGVILLFISLISAIIVYHSKCTLRIWSNILMHIQYEQNEKQYRNKKRKFRIAMISIFLILTLISSTGFLFISYVLGNLKGKELDKKDLGISKGAYSRIANYGNEVKNIILIGLDEPDTPGSPQRSDSMIVFSLDEKHNDIKLSSLMRDTYVDIPGYGTDKLNHSYAYGGEQLLIKTINSNFGLDINDYVTVDFQEMANIIDAVGGVEINVKPEEITYLNYGVLDINRREKVEPTKDYVLNPGLQTLNGKQATAYARIRRVGNGDYERTERQRRVLLTIFNKVKNTSLIDMPSRLTSLSKYFKTSLSLQSMLDLGTKILANKVDEMKQSRFPTDWNLTEVNDPEAWYISYDKAATIWEMGNFIYKDIIPDQTYFNDNYTEGTILPDELEPAPATETNTESNTETTEPAAETETYTEPEYTPEDTQTPDTYAPETQAPDTEAPDTSPPETTQAPSTTVPATTTPATTLPVETTTPDTTPPETTSDTSPDTTPETTPETTSGTTPADTTQSATP